MISYTAKEGKNCYRMGENYKKGRHNAISCQLNIITNKTS